MSLRSTAIRLIPFCALALLSIAVISCNHSSGRQGAGAGDDGNNPANTGGLKILRYEKALFSIPPENFESGIRKIAPEFHIFLGNRYTSPEAMSQLREFAQDRQNKTVYADVLKQYPDLTGLASEFSKAFGRMQNDIAGFSVPQVYTYVSGFDYEYPVKYADSALIIALDMYLGKDYPAYKTLGFPLYVSDRLTPDHILPDCMKEISLRWINNRKNQVLLDAMIEEGKSLYFAGEMLPDTPDNLLIGYSEAQEKWCEENESNIWRFLIENKLLYSADGQSMTLFMTDGPFTSSFSQDSPARTGAWIGWQIVKAYMKKNNNSKLTAMLANTNSQEILEKSGYKPRR